MSIWKSQMTIIFQIIGIWGQRYLELSGLHKNGRHTGWFGIKMLRKILKIPFRFRYIFSISLYQGLFRGWLGATIYNLLCTLGCRPWVGFSPSLDLESKPLRISKSWHKRDSNPGPTDYESETIPLIYHEQLKEIAPSILWILCELWGGG